MQVPSAVERITKCQSALEEQVSLGEVDLETGVRVLADKGKKKTSFKPKGTPVIEGKDCHKELAEKGNIIVYFSHSANEN